MPSESAYGWWNVNIAPKVTPASPQATSTDARPGRANTLAQSRDLARLAARVRPLVHREQEHARERGHRGGGREHRRPAVAGSRSTPPAAGASALVDTIIAPNRPSAWPSSRGGAMSAASVEAATKNSVNAKPCATRRNDEPRSDRVDGQVADTGQGHAAPRRRTRTPAVRADRSTRRRTRPAPRSRTR